MNKPTILTGIRANDEPTLGNYLGAMLPMVELQKQHVLDGEYQLNMFVPDLHSFTTPIDFGTLHHNILRNLKYFISSGLNIENQDTYIYRQSYVPAHSELCVILNNFTYFGELGRMTQFKDKSTELKEQSVTVGLFDYPVLMAADILLYGATYVPVGDDQKQHLELARDLGTRLNTKFNQEIFTLPLEWAKQLAFSHRDSGIRIKSLSNPTNKMSKSVDDPKGTILLSDSPEDAAKKVTGATTDSVGSIHYDVINQPGISNLLTISALLGGSDMAVVTSEWEGKSSYNELKSTVAEQVRQFLTDFQTKYKSVDDQVVLSKLEASEEAMNKAANETLLRVQKAVGLRD